MLTYSSEPEAGFGSAHYEKLPFILHSLPVLAISSNKIEAGMICYKGHGPLLVI